MLFFCDTLEEKLEHMKETVSYIICKNMADPLWQPIMLKRCIELSQLYNYIDALYQRIYGMPITVKKRIP